MSKKLMFILLMSGVIFPPKESYAMDDAYLPSILPRSTLRRGPTSSSQQPAALSAIAEEVPPISMRGKIISPGERLQKRGDDWVNKAGTIVLPTMGPFDKNIAFMPIVIEDGKEATLGHQIGDYLPAVFPLTRGERMHIVEFPGIGVWVGAHHVFRVNDIPYRSYGSVSIDAFPYIDASKVPSAAPAPTL